MKNILITLLLMVVLSSCNEKKTDYTTYNKYFDGNHKLRKFNASERTVSTQKANYFLMFGSAQGETKTISEIAFSWQNHDGEYIFSKVPFKAVRIKFDNNVDTPYITFNMGIPSAENYYKEQINSPDAYVNDIVDRFLFSITIHCKEEDYSQDINLNDLK